MAITATARCTKLAVGTSVKCTLGRRRSLVWGTRPATERILKKTGAPVSSLASARSTEAEVIQLARDGDRSAFERLYRSHSPRVYAVCLRMIGNPTEAEDLTQETFLLLFRKIHTFRGESAFSTWLHRLTVNLVLMHLRKKSPPIVSIEAAANPDDQSDSSEIDIGTRDLLLEGSIDRVNLARCIARLSAGYRTMFVLHDIQGYEHHEIQQSWGAQWVIRNRNYTRPARASVNYSTNFNEKRRANSVWQRQKCLRDPARLCLSTKRKRKSA
jgi:RNA polymerase sigma-70 factor, ECF subfamily